jgi:cation diffusion facilitator CzcD-associated flavoprotein CzcO
MAGTGDPERVQTVVIGGGQAGLSVGYPLGRRGLPFVILDAGERIGDAWRSRWDSLPLFSPARYDGLTGMAFASPGLSRRTRGCDLHHSLLRPNAEDRVQPVEHRLVGA